MSKHTPGPWVVYGTARDDGYTDFYGIDGSDSSAVVLWDKHGGIREIADARLISAAPELLDALEMALEYLESWEDLSAGEHCRVARAAIAKATGEQA